MESLFDNFKFLFELYFRPQRAMSNIIDRGSWLFGAVAVLCVSFAFQYGVNQQIFQTYAVSQLDAYQTQSNFDDVRQNDGRLTAAQLAEAEYYANLDIEKELARERRPFPILGKNILWLFTFQTANFFSILLALAVFYVPATILLLTLFEPIGNFGVLLRRDYGVTLACTWLHGQQRIFRLRLSEFFLKTMRRLTEAFFLLCGSRVVCISAF